MRSALRHAIIMVLLVAFLIPTLVQARPVHDSSAKVAAMGEVTREAGFISMVWNLLTNLLSGSPIMAKEDVAPPSPSTATTPPPPPGDNGGRLDPAG
jgi:uncharacterized membrane protein